MLCCRAVPSISVPLFISFIQDAFWRTEIVFTFICLSLWVCVCARTCVYMWRLVDNFQESCLSFYHGAWGLNSGFRVHAFTCSVITSLACFGDGISLSSLGWPWTHSIAQISLKFMILLILLRSTGVISMCNHIGVHFFFVCDGIKFLFFVLKP